MGGYLNYLREKALAQGKAMLALANKEGGKHFPALTKKLQHIWKRSEGVRNKIGLALEAGAHIGDTVIGGAQMYAGRWDPANVASTTISGVKGAIATKKLIDAFRKPKINKVIHSNAKKKGLGDVERPGSMKNRIPVDKLENMVNSI